MLFELRVTQNFYNIILEVDMKKFILLVALCISVGISCSFAGYNQSNRQEVNMVNDGIEFEQGEIDPGPEYSFETSESMTAASSSLTTYPSFLEAYYRGLTTNLGENYKNSCGYVALGMLLSYYDTYLNDDIIPEEYDIESDGTETNMVSRGNSPGIYHDVIPNGESMSATNYFNKIRSMEDYSLHGKLMIIGEELGILDLDDGNNLGLTTNSERVSILNQYLRGIGIPGGYRIESVSDLTFPQEPTDAQVRTYVKEKIDLGYPVLLSVGKPNSSIGHALICYDYSGSIFFGNMGLTSSKSYAHYNIANKYSTFNDAMILVFNNDTHQHSDNYIVKHNGHIDKYCYCNSNIMTYTSEMTKFDEPDCFTGTFEIPYWMTSMGEDCFDGNKNLRYVTYEDNPHLTEIKDRAFSGCENLRGVDLPNSVETIRNAAFNNCVHLRSITFGENSNLLNIYGYAFQQCCSLESLTIPSSVKNVSYGILSFAEQATVYTDLDRVPNTWDEDWNKADWVSIERPVIWGCTLSSDNSYVVSFYKTASNITRKNAINGIAAPYRKGYVFAGWYINADFSGSHYDASSIATAPNNRTYYAKWIEDCEVAFDYNGGTDTNYTIYIHNGLTINKPADTPIRNNYVFKFWARSDNTDEEFDWNTPITEDIVLKAIWQAKGNDKVVTFDVNGGDATFNTQVLVANGSKVGRPVTPSRVGYTFKYWCLSGQSSAYDFNTPVNADITLVATWDVAQTQTVTFDTDSVYCSFPSIIVNRYDYIEKPDVEPVKVGCHFKYWALSTNTNQEYNWNTLVSSNITLVAVWEEFNRYVTFRPNGGTMPPATIALNVGDCVSDFEKILDDSQPTRTGYTFRFWATSPNSSIAYNLNLPVTNDLTLYAIWKINTYTVSFNLDGGSGSFPSKTINYGSTVSKPTVNPTKDGFVFKYWALSGQTTEYNFNTPITTNITLVAIWEEDSCVAEGTLITLSDGSQKAVEQLTGDEMLLVWNMYTGMFDSAPILCIDSDPLNMYEVIQLSFSDETTVDVISEHGFFDVDLNQYVYLDENAANYIGHRFLKQGANGMIQVTLENVTIVQESTMAYSPVTYGHLCYFVNGMLSIPGGIDGLFNIFEVDGETMMYDAEAMSEDIEKYGLYTYDELNALVPVPEVVFNGVNGQYLKIAVGKGLITIGEIGELVEKYAGLFE